MNKSVPIKGGNLDEWKIFQKDMLLKLPQKEVENLNRLLTCKETSLIIKKLFTGKANDQATSQVIYTKHLNKSSNF